MSVSVREFGSLSRVIPRGATRGRDFWCGMNLQNRSHPERSGGGKAGAAQSKDPVELKRDVPREAHGILRLRSGRKAPFAPLRMTAIWKAVHWQRSAAAGEGGAARRRGTPWKVRSACEADRHRLWRPCRTRLTRGPRLRSARFAASAPLGMTTHLGSVLFWRLMLSV